MKVFCVGLTTKDSIFYLNQFPQGEGKHLANDFLTCGGGPAATAGTAIARLGGKASLWSRVGDDLMGEDILDELNRYEVDTHSVEKIPGCYSTNATVIIDKMGERIIVSYSDIRLYQGDISLSEAMRSFILQHDMVLVDTRWEGAARATLEFAREHNIPSVLDGEVSVNHCVRRLAPLARHAVFSFKGLLDFLETDDEATVYQNLRENLMKIEAELGNRVYMTRGSEGAFYIDDGVLKNVRAYQVNVVDTLGAGDVFHGAFCYFLLKKYPIAEVLRYACAAASMKCTAGGGRGCLPTVPMLKTFLADAVPTS